MSWALPAIGIATGLASMWGSGRAQSNINSAAQAGQSGVSNFIGQGVQATEPFRQQGLGYLEPINTALLGDNAGSNAIGMGRVMSDVNPVDFQNYAANFSMSPEYQYQMRSGLGALNSTAAARGGLLSGANMRANNEMAQDYAYKNLINYYDKFAAGQQQDFTQRQGSLDNMYKQEQLGANAAGQQSTLYGQGASALASLYASQMSASASTAQGKGSGLGSVIGGIMKYGN